jgi:hypothetical protein
LLQYKGLQVCKTLRLVGKLKSYRAFTGSAAMPAHATAVAMHFPGRANTIQSLQKPAALTQQNLKLPKQNSKVWVRQYCPPFNITMGVPLCAWFQKRMSLCGLVVITAAST